MSEHSNEHHITPLSTYLKIYGLLLIFTIITVVIAQFHFGWLNTPLAMGIATVKVYLVMAYFMHLKYDTKLNKITIFTAFFFAFVFFTLTAMDVFTRHNFSNTELKPPVHQQTTEEAPHAE